MKITITREQIVKYFENPVTHLLVGGIPETLQIDIPDEEHTEEKELPLPEEIDVTREDFDEYTIAGTLNQLLAHYKQHLEKCK